MRALQNMSVLERDGRKPGVYRVETRWGFNWIDVGTKFMPRNAGHTFDRLNESALGKAIALQPLGKGLLGNADLCSQPNLTAGNCDCAEECPPRSELLFRVQRLFQLIHNNELQLTTKNVNKEIVGTGRLSGCRFW